LLGRVLPPLKNVIFGLKFLVTNNNGDVERASNNKEEFLVFSIFVLDGNNDALLERNSEVIVPARVIGSLSDPFSSPRAEIVIETDTAGQ